MVPVGGVQGQPQKIGDIPDHPAGEEAPVHLTAAVGNTQPVHLVDQGNGALVVAVEDGGLLLAALGQLGQIVELGQPVPDPDLPGLGPAAPGGPEGLGPPGAVFADKPVGQGENFPGGAVVVLQIENLRPGVNGVEPGQRLGSGGAAAVDALGLVSHP